MDTNTVFVPGPLHPDLFDGETPIMEEAEGRLYECRVLFTGAATYQVFSHDEEEASEAACNMAELDAWGDVDVEGDEVGPVDDQPTADQVAAYKRRTRRVS